MGRAAGEAHKRKRGAICWSQVLHRVRRRARLDVAHEGGIATVQLLVRHLVALVQQVVAALACRGAHHTTSS